MGIMMDFCAWDESPMVGSVSEHLIHDAVGVGIRQWMSFSDIIPLTKSHAMKHAT